MIFTTIKQQKHMAKLIKELANKFPERYIAIEFDHTEYGWGDGIKSKFNYYDDGGRGHRHFETPEELIKYMEGLL